MAAARVLIAEEDLNFHRIINDILEMSLKEVQIERAMSVEGLLDKVRSNEGAYSLILYNIHFDEGTSGQALLELRQHFPQLQPRIVVLVDTDDDVDHHPEAAGLARATKPFSLDEFSELVKSICGE
jgi:DNA-binding NarL/FixJ family response regulator